MRTTEAARYARWSVTVAAMLAVMVAGVYSWRSWQAQHDHLAAPAPVPPAVSQRSAEFTFSKVDGNNTRFILRAAHATEFKDGGRTLLEDVWITTFGGNGKRSDQLHTAACEYFAQSGDVSCPEQALIDLAGNPSGFPNSGTNLGGQSASGQVHVVTRGLHFNRETGIATTAEPVQFRFASGEGQAIGLAYDSERGELHLLHDVELDFEPAASPAGRAATPVTGESTVVSGGELIFRREEKVIHLNGSAVMRRGKEELKAGRITMELDGDMKARLMIAEDHPVLHDPSEDSNITVSGDELRAPVLKSGQISGITATGHVILDALRADGKHHLTAASSVLDLIPESQQPRHFTSTGDVQVASTAQDGATRHLRAQQLEVYFDTSDATKSRMNRATAASGSMDWENAVKGSSKQDAETMRLKGQFLDGSFDEAGVLRELRGNGNVEVQKRSVADGLTTSTSRELQAHMAPDGSWSAIEQSGDVHLKNSTGEARGNRARFNRAEDTLALNGSVVLTDASSQTHADTATFWQSAGKLQAEGSVSTTDLSASSKDGSHEASSESAHITSNRMVSETKGGHGVYSGKARLWQGGSVIQGDTIDLDRTKRTLVATGKVTAMFPQAGPGNNQGSISTEKPRPSTPGSINYWHAQGGRLVYEENEHHVRIEQSARATSSDGSVQADRLDLFLKPSPGGQAGTPTSGAGSALGASLEGQEVQRAQGFGNVRVESGDRIGTGDTGDYTAEDGKFVLFGGHPTLIDKFGNTTAGRQLTFFFSDDRIVVDSAEGSRTLTLHRVEK